MKTAVHPNSIKAHREEAPRLSARSQKIVWAFAGWHTPRTDRQVMRELCYKERNHVQPRITELIKAGVLEEAGKIKCEETGKTVRQVQYVRELEQATLEM